MSSVIIGLTGGGGWDYEGAITAAGGVPVIIPSITPNKLETLFSKIDGILFTGGSDIHPSEYGEKVHDNCGGSLRSRDEQELMLFRYAHQNTNVPILGVCRGLQMMNIALGGTLWQDLKSQHPTHIHDGGMGSFDVCHMVQFAENTKMSRIMPRMAPVNSFHHQGIKDLAKGLIPAAWSPDGLIEAVEDANHDCRIAFQWHPEAMHDKHEHFAHMFKYFVNTARKLAKA